MSELAVYDFEGQAVRVIDSEGQPWWVAADVCRCLGIDKSRDAVSRLEEDERGPVLLDTLGGPQQHQAVNEPGLYSLILTSRKPEAKRFKRWITHEVLPSLRKHGRYVVQDDDCPDRPDYPAMQPGKIEAVTPPDLPVLISLVREARLLYGRSAAIRLWRTLPLPQIEALPPDIAANPLARFVDTLPAVMTGQWVPASDIFRAYQRWASESGLAVMTLRSFGDHIGRLCDRRKQGGVIQYKFS